MNTTDKIISFAELISKEYEVKMNNLQKWEDYIAPLFKAHTGYKFDLAYVSMYSKDNQKWLSAKRIEFNRRILNRAN